MQGLLVSVPHGIFLERSGVSTRQTLQHVGPIPRLVVSSEIQIENYFRPFLLKDAKTLVQSPELGAAWVLHDSSFSSSQRALIMHHHCVVGRRVLEGYSTMEIQGVSGSLY